MILKDWYVRLPNGCGFTYSGATFEMVSALHPDAIEITEVN